MQYSEHYLYFSETMIVLIMQFEFAVPDSPATLPALTLRSVFHVNADSTYDVRGVTPDKTGYVALRSLRGTGLIYLSSDARFNLSTSTLLLVPYESISRYRATGDTWEFWWFDFASDGVPPIRTNAVFTVIESADERAGCFRCLRELKSPFLAQGIAANAEFAMLIARWLVSVRGEDIAEDETTTRLGPAINYIHEHYANHVHVDDLSRMCSLSTRRFTDLFHEYTGSSPAQYLSDIRLGAARETLIQTNLGVKEIASRTGFNDEYYLSKRFKQKYELPPGRFRESLKS